MKIKVAILEKDQNYLKRIVTAFGSKYSDKFEIYSFTDDKIAIKALEDSRIDVFVASAVFEIDLEALPKRCGFAYLVDSPEIYTINEQRTICKFQKADLIYKQILSIYSENAGSVSGLKLGDDSTKIITFASPSGGVGTSCMSASCAIKLAKTGKKVLYLNFEKFGSPDMFFEAEGMFDMSDIIYALKSKKANLTMKLESCVKQDATGVYFYSQAKVALDMFEINSEEIIRLISKLKLSGTYDYIIIDIDFSMSKDYMKVYKQGHAVVWVGDGSKYSNFKIKRAYAAMSIMERNEDDSLLNRMCLAYNKFSSKTSTMLENIDMKSIGGAPTYLHASVKQVVEQLSEMDMFEKII